MNAAVVLLLCMCSLSLAAVHKINLQYKPSLKTRLYGEGKLEEHLKQKAARMHKQSQLDIASTSIIDYEDMAYMGELFKGRIKFTLRTR
ncbi:unnamed protein product [Nippostrongylus brasiliensis]|uniref:Secreted protein n=1 Tax=Nippostrongylus brasiliensis TaxID=27835 RepID=A0A0N4XMC9_NIPBR|nr:unnamed protein product [Nippostrongylus brasiliensis]